MPLPFWCNWFPEVLYNDVIVLHEIIRTFRGLTVSLYILKKIMSYLSTMALPVVSLESSKDLVLNNLFEIAMAEIYLMSNHIISYKCVVYRFQSYK